MSDLVSVIVPVFNVKEYLRKCIESIVIQTYKKIEVIIVDDGSTDGSGQLCDDIAAQDERVKVVHQNNSGLSAARNTGIKIAEGDYLTFVDSDDYVSKNFIAILLNLLKDNHADIAQCGHYIKYGPEKIRSKSRNRHEKVLSSKEALISLCCNGDYDVTAWNKMYKRELFDNIRFPEGQLYEDTATCYLLAEISHRLVVMMEPLYYYVQRYDSIANNHSFNARKLELISAGDQMADYVSEKYPDLVRYTKVKRCYVRLSTLSQLVNAGASDTSLEKKLRAEILKQCPDVILNRRTPKRDKLGILTLAIGFWLYKFVWAYYYKRQRGI